MISTPNGVVIVGHLNLPSHIATDASALYARNVLNFLTAQKNDNGLFAPNVEDEIIKAITLTQGSRVVHGQFV